MRLFASHIHMLFPDGPYIDRVTGYGKAGVVCKELHVSSWWDIVGLGLVLFPRLTGIIEGHFLSRGSAHSLASP